MISFLFHNLFLFLSNMADSDSVIIISDADSEESASEEVIVISSESETPNLGDSDSEEMPASPSLLTGKVNPPRPQSPSIIPPTPPHGRHVMLPSAMRRSGATTVATPTNPLPSTSTHPPNPRPDDSVQILDLEGSETQDPNIQNLEWDCQAWDDDSEYIHFPYDHSPYHSHRPIRSPGNIYSEYQLTQNDPYSSDDSN